jgi:hypothetical protein
MGRAVAGSDNPCRAPGSGNGGFQRDCGQNCGVRESDSNMRRHYDQHDIDFLIGFANVLAAAVATSSRAPVPTASVGEKDRPLEPKEVMAADLRHLVRNNLQLICGMLVARVAHIAGYSRFSLTRASAVVNCQSALA